MQKGVDNDKAGTQAYDGVFGDLPGLYKALYMVSKDMPEDAKEVGQNGTVQKEDPGSGY